MKRKKINIVFASLFVAILFFSCTAPIDINTRNSEPVIVIYGEITDEYKYQIIRITSSSPYFDEKANITVPDAKVWISSSDGNQYSFSGKKDGYYTSDVIFSAIQGVTYTLTVEVDFNKDGIIETYEAKTTIPPIVPADSINMKLIDIMGYRHFALNVFMQEPVESENYYLFKFIVNDSISNYKISDFLISDDQMFNGEYVDAALAYFEDATDEKNIERNNNFGGEIVYMANPGDKFRLQILNIEKGYYNFIRECIAEKYGENPFFGGPPSNITTNFSNEAIGYFSGYCIHEKNTVVP